jgi:hypothetical protein
MYYACRRKEIAWAIINQFLKLPFIFSRKPWLMGAKSRQVCCPTLSFDWRRAYLERKNKIKLIMWRIGNYPNFNMHDGLFMYVTQVDICYEFCPFNMDSFICTYLGWKENHGPFSVNFQSYKCPIATPSWWQPKIGKYSYVALN